MGESHRRFAGTVRSRNLNTFARLSYRHKVTSCRNFVLLCTVLLLAVCRTDFRRILSFKRVKFHSNTATARCRREHSYVNKQDLKLVTSCPSTTLFQVNASTPLTYKRHMNLKSENTPDIYLFIVESLGEDAMQRNMRMTTEVLKKAQAIFFGNFPGRCCGTRPNLIPLFFGSHGFKLFSNLTLDVNISRIEYEENALWKIAQRNERATMYGSTACNLLFACQEVRTADKFTFHDVRQQQSDFQFSFPYEAFYSNPSNTNCYQFEEHWTIDQISRCNSQGPYHHKFFDYYKKFRRTQTRPFFTITHLFEPHGFFRHEALDYHTSQFLDWIIAKKNTLLIFMGDHRQVDTERDVDSTALAIVPPAYLKDVFDPLRPSRNDLLFQEDLHSFTKDILRSVDWRESVIRLKQKLSANHCDMHSNLQSCLCPNVTQTSLVYTEEMKDLVVDYVNMQRQHAPSCLAFTAHDATVENVRRSNTHVSFELHFGNGAIFQSTFSSKDTLKARQLTRYASQEPCAPDGVHPEFCICNEDSFRAAQVRVS